MDYFTAKRLKKLLPNILYFFVFIFLLFVLIAVTHNDKKSVPKALIKDSASETKNSQKDDSTGRVNLHYWEHICGYIVDDLRGHPMFPRFPSSREMVTDLLIRRNTREFGGRVFGYIHPKQAGFYRFGISSDDGSELWLSTDMSPRNIQLVASVSGESGNEWSYEDQFDKYPNQISKGIKLFSDRKYFFEALWKQERVRGHLHVAWMTPRSQAMKTVTKDFLSTFSNDKNIENGLVYANFTASNMISLPSHYLINKRSEKVSKNVERGDKYHRLSPKYLSLPQIEFSEIHHVVGECDYQPSWIIQPNSQESTSLPEYGGVHLPHYFNITTTIYPKDETWDLTQECIGDASLSLMHCQGNRIGDETSAKWVTNKFMTALERSFLTRFKLHTVVNIEQSHDEQNGDRFLLEVVLKDSLYQQDRRLSVYLFRPKMSSRLCYPKNFQWKRNTMINVILTVKNQGVWVYQYIQSLSRIYTQTKDSNFKLIIIDFESFDANLEQMLEESKLPHWQIIKKTGKFHKTSAIQEAIDGIQDENSIALQTDLHLEFPINFMDDTRKHCVQGKMGYTPLLMRLSCGRYSNNPAGFWEAFGYGIFGIYKSDWDRVGGMNVEKFRNAWGGEDWDFADRVIKSGLEIERLRVPYFFHYFHSKKGMWNNKT